VRVGVEDRPDQRAEQPVLVLAGVAEAVPEEVDGAALPGAAEDLRDRCLQAGVGVADSELDADQAALDQRAQELGPERLGLGLADVDREDLAAARLVDAVGDHQRLVDHPPAVADLLDLRVQEQIRVGALQRTETLDRARRHENIDQPRTIDEATASWFREKREAEANEPPETRDAWQDAPRRGDPLAAAMNDFMGEIHERNVTDRKARDLVRAQESRGR
jgi:hypothetical protein